LSNLEKKNLKLSIENTKIYFGKGLESEFTIKDLCEALELDFDFFINKCYEYTNGNGRSAEIFLNFQNFNKFLKRNNCL
jgi:hypothetical protein